MFFQETGKFYIRIEERFESSHFLYKYFPDGSDEPIHGHSFKVEVYLSGKRNIGEDGISFDFLTSKKRLRELVSELDHILINQHADFTRTNPTSENMARWFYHHIKDSVHASSGKVDRIVIHEGPENLAFFEPSEG
ncbi:6-carboxytetrahydropterin synthase [Leptospira fluminis]|uniref:6-carboxy-5,6,7,8-tetrahydropterin synthase n=1 Tax=Leptospira fluminis TaxID=2484979 RepID=A0A4R9GMJ9_9LEPT|nr:6-carboxytetrahydropterin synthase [Leptospira fluminis]TGK15124.1 6-carboxytetrahydropterin synthase [Leptospira fluminis]